MEDRTSYFFLIRILKVYVLITICQMGHITELGHGHQIRLHDLGPWHPGLLPPAEAGRRAPLLTLFLALVGAHRADTGCCTSGKEETTLSEHFIVGSKTQEPQRILSSPWLLNTEREKWGEAGWWQGGAVGLYLRT